MPKLAVGIDIIEIKRIEDAILEWQDSFLFKVYTKAELSSCNNAVSSLAARFAAKEAVMKALGTGTVGMRWPDIEIMSDSNGLPVVQLHGSAYEKSLELGIQEFSISISHSDIHAVAVVIGNT
jgi:holo-[acyl-carrier protein] synthase